MRWTSILLAASVLLFAQLVVVHAGGKKQGGAGKSGGNGGSPGKSGGTGKGNPTTPPPGTKNATPPGGGKGTNPSGGKSEIKPTGKGATDTKNKATPTGNNDGKGGKGKGDSKGKGDGKSAQTKNTIPGTKGNSGQSQLSTQHRDFIAKTQKNPNLSKPESAALGKVLNRQILQPQERAMLSTLAATGRTGISKDDRVAITRALDDDMDRRKAPVAGLDRRFLGIRNNTGLPLTVFVVYQTVDDEQRPVWRPGEPPDRGQPTTSQVVRVRVSPGQWVVPEHGEEKILASRARVWAEAEGNRSWNAWRDRDFLLVPEKDDSGNHRYHADSYETKTLRFEPQTP